MCIEEKKRKEKEKNYIGNETTPYIDLGKGDTLARRAVSLLHQGGIRIIKNSIVSLLATCQVAWSVWCTLSMSAASPHILKSMSSHIFHTLHLLKSHGQATSLIWLQQF